MKHSAILFLLALLPMVAEADDSGSCGVGLTYTYKEASHTLTIKGNGEMDNYSQDRFNAPWGSYRHDILVIDIEDGVTSVGRNAFRDCYYMTTVHFPNTLTHIASQAFMGCCNLDSLIIPASVTSIDLGAFYRCIRISAISVEAGNGVYDSRNNCNALIETSTNTLNYGCKNTIIPDGIVTIGGAAFYGCELPSVDIPGSVTTIGDAAFQGCGYLSTVDIPYGVTTIGENAFKNCNGLLEVTTPSSVVSIGNSAFQGCTKLESAFIPNSVSTLGTSMFYECKNLKKANLPEGITRLPAYYLYKCSSITEFTIPASVDEIYYYAFDGCTGLTSLTCLNPVPPTCLFGLNVDFSIPLYVPEGSLIKYKAADHWRNFVMIYEVDYKPDTSILGTAADSIQQVSPYYTLGGVRLSQPRKGIYIKNGKKVVIK
jgi:hypothetical protein